MITSAERFRPYMLKEDFERIKNYNSMSHMWADCLENYGSKIAIEYDGRSYTYNEIENMAASIRGALANACCAGGSRVGIFAENGIDFVAAFVGATTFGLCAAVLPPHLNDAAVLACSMQFGLSAIVASPAKAADCAMAEARLSIPTINCACIDAEALPSIHVEEAQECAIVFTGGTTGKSKGALLSNGAVMQGVFNGCLGVSPAFEQRYILALPLSHVFGLIRNLLVSLCTGSTMFICRNSQDIFRDIATFRPTVLVLVPALAEMALNLSKKFRRNMLGEDLKNVICGAAAVPPYLIEEYRKLGISLYPGYGLTESANLVSGNPDNISKPESVGLPYPNQELKIVDGELWLKGRNIMDGYVGSTEEAFTEDGWFKTGDLVRMDEDGFLFITGRIKEIIVLPSGENVSPAEVEASFLQCQLVQDCQVFEDIAEGGRHILALEVVPRAVEMAKLPPEEAQKMLMDNLESINQSLPAFQRVNRISIRETDFERTKSMKIVRYKKCK